MENRDFEEKISELNDKVLKLTNDLRSIKERNRKVELSKAWETSFIRICSITILTYLITSIVFWIIGVPNFLLNALIPTIGYVLSIQSMPKIRDKWVKNFSDRNSKAE